MRTWSQGKCVDIFLERRPYRRVRLIASVAASYQTQSERNHC